MLNTKRHASAALHRNGHAVEEMGADGIRVTPRAVRAGGDKQRLHSCIFIITRRVGRLRLHITFSTVCKTHESMALRIYQCSSPATIAVLSRPCSSLPTLALLRLQCAYPWSITIALPRWIAAGSPSRQTQAVSRYLLTAPHPHRILPLLRYRVNELQSILCHSPTSLHSKWKQLRPHLRRCAAILCPFLLLFQASY